MTPNAGYHVRVATTIEELLTLRCSWQGMVSELNADLDFYITILQSRSEVLRPHVILVENNGVPVSFLVGRLESKPFDIRLGYKTFSLPIVRWLTFVHGGFFGDTSPERINELVASVANSLRSGVADLAWFHQLEAESAALQFVRRTGGVLSGDYVSVYTDHWTTHIGGSYEEFVKGLSKNTRHNLKRYSKRLQEKFGTAITIRSFRQAAEVETLLTDCETVAARSYHRGLNVGFTVNEETRQLTALAAARGWLRGYVLYIDHKPCAFWTGYLYNRKFCAWTTAFDPDYESYRPGLFLLQKLVADVCDDNAADELDFGFGDAQYKRDWCDCNRQGVTYYLFAPTVIGTALNLVRTPLLMASNLTREALRKTGLLQKAKKVWRQCATS